MCKTKSLKLIKILKKINCSCGCRLKENKKKTKK